MFFFNPLEQFDITLFGWSSFTNLAFTNINAALFINLVFIALIFYFSDYYFFGLGFFYRLQFFFDFVVSLFQDSILLKKYSPVLLFFYTFCFIFACNLLGLVPYSITVTSHLIITLFFSLSFFIGSNIISAIYHQEKFFELFLPDGIPVVIIPALILIEYISYFSKIFSLAIRLFANMMSGHILLKILIGFSWTLFAQGFLGFFLSLLPFAVVFLVIGLEFAIAFLQAYVFTILLIIYLNDALNIH